MPILLWVIYPIALWSACDGIIAPPNNETTAESCPNPEQ
jgi:hypothetical protein